MFVPDNLSLSLSLFPPLSLSLSRARSRSLAHQAQDAERLRNLKQKLISLENPTKKSDVGAKFDNMERRRKQKLLSLEKDDAHTKKAHYVHTKAVPLVTQAWKQQLTQVLCVYLCLCVCVRLCLCLSLSLRLCFCLRLTYTSVCVYVCGAVCGCDTGI